MCNTPICKYSLFFVQSYYFQTFRVQILEKLSVRIFDVDDSGEMLPVRHDLIVRAKSRFSLLEMLEDSIFIVKLSINPPENGS